MDLMNPGSLNDFSAERGLLPTDGEAVELYSVADARNRDALLAVNPEAPTPALVIVTKER